MPATGGPTVTVEREVPLSVAVRDDRQGAARYGPEKLVDALKAKLAGAM